MAHASRLGDGQTRDEITRRILEALPGSKVKVSGGGGHYIISVVSSEFQGLRTLAKKRLVYSAIKELMDGDDAPVHAVDRLDTNTP